MASGYAYSQAPSPYSPYSQPHPQITEIPLQTLAPAATDTKSKRNEAYDSAAFQSPLLGGSEVRLTSPGHASTWPQMPRALRRSRLETVFTLIGDIILLCAWLAVAAFAIGIVMSGGVSRADIVLGENLLTQARIIAPTLFPILFAATVGRFVKLISMYRVERGERLGVLDQLQGSTSFVGTLITAVTVRGAAFLTIVLLLLWALSPLGGQASFRSFDFQGNETETAVIFPYLSMNNSDQIIGASSDRITFVSRVNALFSAVVVGSQNSTDAPMDIWGNVKIPYVDAVAKTRQPDADGWVELDADGVDTMEYSSLIGVPIGMNAATNSSARIQFETSYWTLQCPVFTMNGDRQIENVSEVIPYNYTARAIELWTDRQLSLGSNGSDQWPSRARRVAFVIQDWDALFMDCTLQTTYVEMEISCQKTACFASKIRRSKLAHPSENITGLDYEGPPRSPYFENFITAIPGRNNRPSVLSHFIDTILGTPLTERTGAEVAVANPRGYEALLAQALNTYWIASIAPDYVTDQRNSNYSTEGPIQVAFTTVEPKFENATGAVWTEEPIFTYSPGWLALLFIAVIAALAACVANIVLSAYFIRSPLLTMNFTTMARDNPYVQMPPGGSALSDYDRGKWMRDARVRYGDVAPGARIGHIAIGRIDDGSYGGGREVAPLDKSRLYD